MSSCTMCAKELPPGSALRKYCAACRKLRNCEINKKYAADNKDKIALLWADYAKKNREALLERDKKRYAENKEMYAKRWAEYYASKGDQLLAGARKYYAENPDKALLKRCKGEFKKRLGFYPPEDVLEASVLVRKIKRFIKEKQDVNNQTTA